jgi:hypothetical protein
MSPPTANAVERMGGTVSLLQSQMVNAARLIFDNCGVHCSENKLSRMVRRFINFAPNAGGAAFFAFLVGEVQLSESQKRMALANPDVARAISYADPTGETAVNNVLKGY